MAVQTVNGFHDLRADAMISGYASLFGVEDQTRDMVMPGAFRASLARRPPSAVRMLFQHNPAQPVGVWEDIREDARGLYVRGRLSEGVAKSDDLRSLLRDGAIDGLSIGFRAVKTRRDAKGSRLLTEIDLWEISIVTFPMLTGARVAAAAKPVIASAKMEPARKLVAAAGMLRAARHDVLIRPRNH